MKHFPSSGGHPRPAREGVAARRGFALIVVLIMAGAVAVFAVTMIRVARNNQLTGLAAYRSTVARNAAVGSTHRGLAMLRRDRKLRGVVVASAPEAALGVISEVQILDRADGNVEITARCTFQGTVEDARVIVDPKRR